MLDSDLFGIGGGCPPRIMEELSTSFSMAFQASVFHALVVWETLL